MMVDDCKCDGGTQTTPMNTAPAPDEHGLLPATYSHTWTRERWLHEMGNPGLAVMWMTRDLGRGVKLLYSGVQPRLVTGGVRVCFTAENLVCQGNA